MIKKIPPRHRGTRTCHARSQFCHETFYRRGTTVHPPSHLIVACRSNSAVSRPKAVCVAYLGELTHEHLICDSVSGHERHSTVSSMIEYRTKYRGQKMKSMRGEIVYIRFTLKNCVSYEVDDDNSNVVTSREPSWSGIVFYI